MLRSMITASDRYSGNDRYSGIKSPDRFFHYSGRCLYLPFLVSLSSTRDNLVEFLVYDLAYLAHFCIAEEELRSGSQPTHVLRYNIIV